MIRIGKLRSVTGIPKIVVSVSDKVNLGRIRKSGADILEVRVDAFGSLSENYIFKKLGVYKKAGLPIILTVRAKDEGGKVYLSDAKRLGLFNGLAPIVDILDIELNSTILGNVAGIARKNKKALIVSWHNFKRTPKGEELEELFKKARKYGGIVKIAAYAKSKEDVLSLMHWTLKHKAEPLITISLGRIGSISRLVLPFCGSLVSYTYLKEPFAPGQISCAELVKQFKLYNLNGLLK